MNREVRIVVACASSVAQCAMMEKRISAEFKARGIPVKVTKCAFPELKAKVAGSNPDMIVTAGETGYTKEFTLPVFNGLALVTGFGKDKVFEDIFKVVETLE